MPSDFPSHGFIVRFADKAAAFLTLVQMREYLASPAGQDQPEPLHRIIVWSPPTHSPAAELYMSPSAYALCENLGLDCKEIIEIPVSSLPEDRVVAIGKMDEPQLI